MRENMEFWTSAEGLLPETCADREKPLSLLKKYAVAEFFDTSTLNVQSSYISKNRLPDRFGVTLKILYFISPSSDIMPNIRTSVKSASRN